jgi:hypothetical protein
LTGVTLNVTLWASASKLPVESAPLNVKRCSSKPLPFSRCTPNALCRNVSRADHSQPSRPHRSGASARRWHCRCARWPGPAGRPVAVSEVGCAQRHGRVFAVVLWRFAIGRGVSQC